MGTSSRLSETGAGERVIAAAPLWRRWWAGRRGRLHLAVALVLAAVVGGGIYAVLSVSAPDGGAALSGRTGAPAPRFSLPELTDAGRVISLGQLRGHDVVLNFWASWCYPCTTEMPVLQAAHQSDPKVRFVGIDTNDTRSDALGFLGHVKVSYLTLYDPHGTAANSYGLIGLPTTVFVSPRGKVLGRHQGQMDSSTLAAALHEAFDSGG